MSNLHPSVSSFVTQEQTFWWLPTATVTVPTASSPTGQLKGAFRGQHYPPSLVYMSSETPTTGQCHYKRQGRDTMQPCIIRSAMKHWRPLTSEKKRRTTETWLRTEQDEEQESCHETLKCRNFWQALITLCLFFPLIENRNKMHCVWLAPAPSCQVWAGKLISTKHHIKCFLVLS